MRLANGIIIDVKKLSLFRWRFGKPPFSFSISEKQYIGFGLAALGGSRIDRPV